jgi:hypothetical protein
LTIFVPGQGFEGFNTKASPLGLGFVGCPDTSVKSSRTGVRLPGQDAEGSAARECSCRANRVLPRPESLADVLLRVLQEVVSPMQGIAAAVQDLPGILLYRPDARSCTYSPICRPHSHTTAAPRTAPSTKAPLVRIAVLLLHLSRMSFLTDFTPAIPPATLRAWSMSA